MSLAIVIKAPEGLVLAADSRVTIEIEPIGANGEPFSVSFDNATKLVSFGEPNSAYGAVTCGLAVIGLRTGHSLLPEFQSTLSTKTLKVATFAKKLSDFFTEQWRENKSKLNEGIPMTFMVGGFDAGQPYGGVFSFEIPGMPKPVEMFPG